MLFRSGYALTKREAPSRYSHGECPLRSSLPAASHPSFSLQVHTIVQYRAIDFGMEDCRLVFTLPALGMPLEDHASFSMRPQSRFDVFRLAVGRPLNTKVLSYRTKPKISEKIATLQAHLDGETEIYRFPCPRASLHVFEVACAEGSDCFLDVWSSQNTSYGMLVFTRREEG